MKIGIKYCGGCNSRYDRTKEVAKLTARFPEHTFTYCTDKEFVDMCLLVCGCMTACAGREGVHARQFVQLCTPKQFAALANTLASTAAETPPTRPRMLHPGDSASLTKTFTEADIQTFAALTGDCGKLHVDPAFAAQYGFGRPVVHGVLTGSLMSAVMGTKLPGNGTILMDETVRYLAPVYAGDTITATVTLHSAKESKRWFTGELHGVCTNQDGTAVAEGTYHQLMMKTLFTVENRYYTPGRPVR